MAHSIIWSGYRVVSAKKLFEVLVWVVNGKKNFRAIGNVFFWSAGVTGFVIA